MLNYYKFFFILTLMIGTLISISTLNWFSMWIGLEINLLSIIPLFKSANNSFPAEATLKYFITQTLASSFILFSISMSMNLSEFLTMNLNYWLMMILNSALFLKLGTAPFHSWFPEVAEGLNWNNNIILMTWQKIAPMILISYNLNMFLTNLMIIFSAIISGIFGINQISLRKILAYSSINHMAWMLSSMISSSSIWMIYFLIYTFITMNIIFMFKIMNIFFLPQISLILNQNSLIKIIFMMNFFSLGGLPPFLGFLPKWLVINNLVNNHNYLLSFILIIFTLLTLFFYLRMTFSSLTLTKNETILNLSSYKNSFLIIFNMVNLMGIFISMNIFLFL